MSINGLCIVVAIAVEAAFHVINNDDATWTGTDTVITPLPCFASRALDSIDNFTGMKNRLAAAFKRKGWIEGPGRKDKKRGEGP